MLEGAPHPGPLMWKQTGVGSQASGPFRPVFPEQLCCAPGLCPGVLASLHAEGFVAVETLLS